MISISTFLGGRWVAAIIIDWVTNTIVMGLDVELFAFDSSQCSQIAIELFHCSIQADSDQTIGSFVLMCVWPARHQAPLGFYQQCAGRGGNWLCCS